MTRRCLPALLLALASTGAAAAQPGKFETETIKNIAYYEGDDAHPVRHRLDLYLPKGERDFPVLFFIHGGGWTFGAKEYYGFTPGVARNFTRYGVGVVAVNYRLTPQVRHPEHIRDVARAFAWTHANIGKYGGRPDQLFVSGHSAGGHLAALLATNEKYLKEQGLTLSAIRGAIPISGVFVLARERIFEATFGREVLASGDAAPVANVNAACPPFLIIYADNDFPHCDRPGAEALHKALCGERCTAAIYEVPGRNHLSVFAAALWDTDPLIHAMLSFIMARATVDRYAANPAAGMNALGNLVSRYADR